MIIFACGAFVSDAVVIDADPPSGTVSTSVLRVLVTAARELIKVLALFMPLLICRDLSSTVATAAAQPKT